MNPNSSSILFAQFPVSLQLIVYAVLALFAFIVFVIVINFAHVWVRAWSSGAPVGFIELISLRLRRAPVGLIVDNRINAIKSGLNVSIDDLSTHYLAGGNVQMVVLALIAARKAGIHLEFDRACAIDLRALKIKVRSACGSGVARFDIELMHAAGGDDQAARCRPAADDGAK